MRNLIPCDLCVLKTHYKIYLLMFVYTKPIQNMTLCDVCVIKTCEKYIFSCDICVPIKKIQFSCDVCVFKTNKTLCVGVSIPTSMT